MLEKEIEKQVCAHAVKLGWLVYKFVSPERRGVPDRMLAKNGHVLFIEFKQRGKRPTKLQAKHIDRLTGAGLECKVIDSVTEGIALLEDHHANRKRTAPGAE